MFYLAIIGGGPAGYTAAEQASKAGQHVVLFEQTALGGTCLNVGCIPTKSLLYSAKQYHLATHAQKYGVLAPQVSFDFAAMQKRKTIVVRKLVAGIKQRLNNDYCTVVNGAATVLSRTDDQVVIDCNGQQYTAQNLLICTGSTNFVPPIPGIADNDHVWDSTAALASTTLPESITIVGGGVIGMEFATLYHELGIRVTVIEAMPTILPNLDPDIVAILLEQYRKSGIDILTSTRVESISGGCISARSTAEPDSPLLSISSERILISVGRRANLQGLDALSDLELHRGGIVVDDFMRTNLPNVFACGDVTGKIMLAHVASRQAEVCIGRLLRQVPLQRLAYNAVPSVVYTNPEIASVGLTLQQALELNIPAEEHQLPMTYSGRFVAENDGQTGLCKLIVDSHKSTILGVHLIGNPCSEFISAASVAVRNGYTVPELRQVIFPHPTVSEILHEVLHTD